MALHHHHKGARGASPANHRRPSRLPSVRAQALLSTLFQPKQQQQKKQLAPVVPPDCARAQSQILEALTGAVGRGREGLGAGQLALLDAAVAQLEASGKGVPDAASSPLLDGRWRLIFTSRPGSASPIQRTFVGVDAFSVQQWVAGLGASDDNDDESNDNQQKQQPRVDNVVRFGKGADAWGYLRVEAEASTQRRPLPGFTPRSGAGLPLFGKSFNTPPAAGAGARVDFAFDRAAFYLFGGKVQVPYPVPFRLLGDERKGWLDVTYLSRDGRFRLSRGNKGTLFILQREEEEEEADEGGGGESEGAEEQEEVAVVVNDDGPGAFFARLFSPPGGGASSSSGSREKNKAPPPPAVADVLAAARASAAAPSDAAKAAAALALVERLVASGPSSGRGSGVVRKPARDAKAVSGVWRLLWTQQSASASALQKWGASQAKSYQVIDALDRGVAMNVVDLRPFAEVRAFARCEAKSDTRTGVRIESGEVVFAPPGPGGGGGEGGLRVPLPIKGSDAGYVDWLYLDRDVRVTRGSKGSLFLHEREGDADEAAEAIPEF